MTESTTKTTEQSISNSVDTTMEKSWETEIGTKRIADILRGRKGMAVRDAIELGKRVEFIRGDKLVSFLLKSSVIKKNFPDIQTKEDAHLVGTSLIQNGYIHRSERDKTNKKVLTPCQVHNFATDGYYTWMYDGPKTLRNIMTALLIIGAVGVTCFPIWPQFAKVAIWYMSVTFLIFLTVFITLRNTLFFLSWIIGFEIWFLPNIFDDDLGVVDSFYPLYSIRVTETYERIYRLLGVGALVAFIVYIKNQPSDFDDYVTMTKQFTDDMYSGKLLSDMAQKEQDGNLNLPDLEQLMKEDAEDIEEENDKFTPVTEEKTEQEHDGYHEDDDELDKLMEGEHDDEDDDEEGQ